MRACFRLCRLVLLARCLHRRASACPRPAASMYFPVTFVARAELTVLFLLLACALPRSAACCPCRRRRRRLSADVDYRLRGP